MGETWTLSLCIFRTCGLPSCLSSLFIPHVKGALRVEWVRTHVLLSPCLGWVCWSSSQNHTSPRMLCWRCFHVRAAHVFLETSMAADSRDCEGAAGFLYTCSRSPTDLVFWDWPNLGQRLRAAGLGVTAHLRTQYSLQTEALGGFDHNLCTLLNSFIYLSFFLIVLHLSCGIFLYTLSMISLSDILFVIFYRLSFHPTDCLRDYAFTLFLS